MKRVPQTRMALVVAASLLVVLLWSAQAFAGAVMLILDRTSLVNVADDGAGHWQIEGGVISKGEVGVGQYAIHRRVVDTGSFGGTKDQNTAMETVTLFFSQTGLPPQNITLQGAYHFGNGKFFGGVSAASNRYSWINGADAIIIPTGIVGTSTLSITWTGAGPLTLP